ncbi:MAG TPA: GNAT family N-acetyltransferase [Ktedonobacterales bacterium]
MLYQLPPEDFARVQSLVAADDNYLAAVSALAGESPADLYVDDPHDPHAALLLLWNGRLFLAGEPGDGPFARAVAALLRERYTPTDPGTDPAYCVLAYHPSGWDAYLPALLSGLAASRREREYFRLHLTAPLAPPALPDGFRLRPVDAALLADTALGNLDLLLEESQSEAPSVAAFLAGRFGSCVQHGTDLVAWCLSEYNHGDRCELGIETLEPYRRQGLALDAAQATLAHALRAGITDVGWHCWTNNLPSSALARKLGFTKVRDHAVWLCRFDPPPPER